MSKLDPAFLHVRYKMCAECLFTTHRLVDRAHATEIIEQAVDSGGYFICHKWTYGAGAEEQEMANEGARLPAVCCRGFFDQRNTAATGLAKALGLVVFVDDDGGEVGPPPSALRRDG